MTYTQLNDFYKQRISPEFDDGYYATLVDKKNMSMNQFKIRDSTMTFRSSSKGASLEGTTTDYLSLDEYEHVSAQAEYSALESMSSSDYQIIRRWSTPSVAGYGIAKKYDESDQRKWVVKCTHCGYEQVLDFEKNIKLVDKDGIDIASKIILPGTYQYVCQKCGKLLDRWYNGHWQTMSPGAGKPHGYKFSQLDAVWINK